MEINLDKTLEAMSKEDKIALLTGKGLWETRDFPHFNLPSITVADGPHGLGKREANKDHSDLEGTTKAVCFPTGSALAASFDKDLIYEVAKRIGEAAKSENVGTVLGPAINIKRSPLCGRNFEYLSEDPYLTGELATAYVKGMQDQSVGTSLKHFAVNNQETNRMTVDARVSERALREIYLPGFEKTIKEAQPWSVMASYNLVNGSYSTENTYLLNDILRNEWGFSGIVISDWGAVNDKVAAIAAGLNIEMPESHYADKDILKALEDGTLSEEQFDARVREILDWINKCSTSDAKSDLANEKYNKDEHHNFAKYAASQSAVLLKNNNKALPISEKESVLALGPYLKEPRFQGGGSSSVRAYKVSGAYEILKDKDNFSFIDEVINDKLELDPEKLEQAKEAAKANDKVVIFAGLPNSFEIEGIDRQNLKMPASQNILIKEIAKINPNTIVLLHKGSPIEMEWERDVAAILDLHLGGEAVGAAASEILLGEINPSGKLAETYPLRIEDTPAFGNFPGNPKSVNYTEDIFVGYRWYDTRKMDVLYPFGHGLSYSEFEYSNLSVKQINEFNYKVKFTLKNTSDILGKEAYQLYVATKDSKYSRPEKELKGFGKVELNPGEEKDIELELDYRSFAIYNEEIKDWFVPYGDYEILIGSSSRDIRLAETLEIKGDTHPLVVNSQMTLEDIIMTNNFDKVKDLFFDMCIRSNNQDFLVHMKYIDENQEKIIKKEIMVGGIQEPIHFYPCYFKVADNFVEKIYKKIEKGE